MIAARKTWLLAACLVASAGVAHAGEFQSGEWLPTRCGARPVAPNVNGSSVAAYNDSQKAIKAWTDKINEYERCYMSDLNRDNAAMKSSADTEQAQTKAEFDKLNGTSKQVNEKFNPSKPQNGLGLDNKVRETDRPSTSPYPQLEGH